VGAEGATVRSLAAAARGEAGAFGLADGRFWDLDVVFAKRSLPSRR
jgi:hypothetical protein